MSTTGDKLNDIEWRFGITAASSSQDGSPFVQMRLDFENKDPVPIEMGIMEFYEFAGDIKRIQTQMSSIVGM